MSTYAADRAEPLPWETPKDPEGVDDYQFDFSDYLGTETISGTPTVTSDAGLTVGAVTVSAGVVNVRLSGGTAGSGYVVKCVANTSAGRTVPLRGLLSVAER